MQSVFHFIADFLFPPSEETLKLRSFSPAELFHTLPPAPAAPFPFITSVFAYKDPIAAELVHSVKNKNDRRAFGQAGYALYEKLKEMEPEKALLAPIPLSKKRRRERGYNQCELLIKEIIKLDAEKRFEMRWDILVRSKHTGEQKLKNRMERLGSADDIFTAADRDSDLPVIIIDDVTTTESTATSARKTLITAGYSNVRVLTLAH